MPDLDAKRLYSIIGGLTRKLPYGLRDAAYSDLLVFGVSFIGGPEAYAFTSLRNRTRDFLRSAKGKDVMRHADVVDALELVGEGTEDEEVALRERENLSCAYRAIFHMSDSERVAFVAAVKLVRQGKAVTARECAKTSGLSKTWMSKALQGMRGVVRRVKEDARFPIKRKMGNVDDLWNAIRKSGIL